MRGVSAVEDCGYGMRSLTVQPYRRPSDLRKAKGNHNNSLSRAVKKLLRMWKSSTNLILGLFPEQLALAVEVTSRTLRRLLNAEEQVCLSEIGDRGPCLTR